MLTKINVNFEMDCVDLRKTLQDYTNVRDVVNRLTNKELDLVVNTFDLGVYEVIDISNIVEFFWFQLEDICDTVLEISEDEFWDRPDDWYIIGSLKEIENDLNTALMKMK